MIFLFIPILSQAQVPYKLKQFQSGTDFSALNEDFNFMEVELNKLGINTNNSIYSLQVNLSSETTNRKNADNYQLNLINQLQISTSNDHSKLINLTNDDHKQYLSTASYRGMQTIDLVNGSSICFTQRVGGAGSLVIKDEPYTDPALYFLPANYSETPYASALKIYQTYGAGDLNSYIDAGVSNGSINNYSNNLNLKGGNLLYLWGNYAASTHYVELNNANMYLESMGLVQDGGASNSFSGLGIFEAGLDTNALYPYTGSIINMGGSNPAMTIMGDRVFGTTNWNNLVRPAFATYIYEGYLGLNNKTYYGMGQISSGVGIIANDDSGSGNTSIRFYIGDLGQYGGACHETVSIDKTGLKVSYGDLTSNGCIVSKSSVAVNRIQPYSGSSVSFSTNIVSDVTDPVNQQDVATKHYVAIATSTITGTIQGFWQKDIITGNVTFLNAEDENGLWQRDDVHHCITPKSLGTVATDKHWAINVNGGIYPK